MPVSARLQGVTNRLSLLSSPQPLQTLGTRTSGLKATGARIGLFWG